MFATTIEARAQGVQHRALGPEQAQATLHLQNDKAYRDSRWPSGTKTIWCSG